DMLAFASGEQFEKSLRVLLEDPDVDAVIVINIPIKQPEEIAEGIKKAMVEYKGEKPVLACFMMSAALGVNLRYASNALVPVYMFPEGAVQALALQWPYSLHRHREEGQIVVFPDIDDESARKYLLTSGALQKEGGWLAPDVAIGLLKGYGIPTADTKYAFTPEEAVEAARQIGFPVVMKLRSTSVTHKTDVGGVVLNLENEEEVKKAFLDMEARLKS